MTTDDPDDGPDYSGIDPDSGIRWGDSWSVFTREERAEAWRVWGAAYAADRRREQRREEKRQIRVIKAAMKAGLPVRRAIVDGVTVELDKVTATPARGSAVELRGEPADEVEAWIKKQVARAPH
jgi:hypothetical protein